jgi:hypothetical protein
MRFFLLRYSILLLVLLLSSQTIEAQSTNTISGIVTESGTDEPIQGVSVFLDGTTIGISTDQNGRFELRNIPNGHYFLIVSMTGYSRFSQAVEFPNEYDELKVLLDEQFYQLSDIVVTAEQDDLWNTHLVRFRQIILSDTPNARRSTILNPFVIDFNDQPPYLLATAHESIFVENMGLGYLIEIVLTGFSYNRNTRIFSYEIAPRFEEIPPQNNRQERRFASQRQSIYEGSANQFFKLLAAQQDTIKNGRLGDFEIMVQPTLRILYPEEYLFELSAGTRTWVRNDIAPNQLFIENSDGDRELRRNFIFIRYTKKVEHSTYQQITERSRSEAMYQYSVLHVSRNVRLSASGNLHDPGAGTFYGYLAWKRLADLLPTDYHPNFD